MVVARAPKAFGAVAVAVAPIQTADVVALIRAARAGGRCATRLTRLAVAAGHLREFTITAGAAVATATLAARLSAHRHTFAERTVFGAGFALT